MRAQARGNGEAMLRLLAGCSADPRCATRVRANVKALHRPGAVKLVRFDPSTSFALSPHTGRARVVWNTVDVHEPVVQCVIVQRTGNVLSGPGVKLRYVSGPRPRYQQLLTVGSRRNAGPQLHPPSRVNRPRMRARLIFLALVGAVVLGGLPAHALGAAERPTNQKLYTDGYDDRMLLGGQWLLKRDRLNVGQQRHFERQRGTAGWSPITVPNAWNAGDDSNESMVGGVAYYRKDFILPGSPNAATWVARFESVNYRATVYLNGKEIGEHTGAYLPFEFALNGVKKGVNRLVDPRRQRAPALRLPAVGLQRHRRAGRAAGGTTAGSPARSTCARSPAASTTATSRCARSSTPARRRRRGSSGRSTSTTGATRPRRPASRPTSASRRSTSAPSTSAEAARERSPRTMRLPNPHLWSPNDPFLYPVHIGGTPGGYTLHIGVRSISVSPDGHLLLNGQPTNFRGVGLHEDSLDKGSAIDNATRDRYIAEIKDLGATMIRTHYPLSPYLLEQADKNGILVWSEIPVYSLRSSYFAKRIVRHLAFQELTDNINDNQNHASIAIWSVANELRVQAAGPGALLPPRRRGRPRAAWTRPAPSAWPSSATRPPAASAPTTACRSSASTSTSAGTRARSGQVADEDLLSGYLDSVHACYPNKAIVVTEFGAEANRDGPSDEKGTYAFQQDFVKYHLNVFAHEAVAERRDLLDAGRVPGAPGLGRRQPEARSALPPEGADQHRRDAEAGLRRRPADLPQHDAVQRAGRGRSGRGVGSRASGVGVNGPGSDARRPTRAEPDRGVGTRCRLVGPPPLRPPDGVADAAGAAEAHRRLLGVGQRQPAVARAARVLRRPAVVAPAAVTVVLARCAVVGLERQPATFRTAEPRPSAWTPVRRRISPPSRTIPVSVPLRDRCTPNRTPWHRGQNPRPWRSPRAAPRARAPCAACVARPGPRHRLRRRRRAGRLRGRRPRSCAWRSPSAAPCSTSSSTAAPPSR